MAKVITSHSNYVLRRKAQATSLGTIYERDWMTVSEMDGFAPGLLPVYQSGNFKITINGEATPRKKYSYSNWIKNGEDEFWTLDNTDVIEVKVDKTVLKPNYTSLLDFAYYGSAKELIRASVTDIIKKFPAEVYFSDSTYEILKGEEIVDLKYYGDENGLASQSFTLYQVENPFGIDFGSVYKEPLPDDNVDRFICQSAYKYEVIYHEGQADERRFNLCWDVNNLNVKCTGIDPTKYIVVNSTASVTNPDESKFYLVQDSVTSAYTKFKKYLYFPETSSWEDAGDYYLYDYTLLYTANLGFTTVYGLSVDGKEMLFHDGSCTGFHIRMKDEYIEEAFEKFDDFERALLNRDTVPTYKITLETPRETDKGYVFSYEDYVWPTVNGWNIDVTDAAYQSYIDSLIAVAEYYDEYKSDSIIRAYTHETITNFDWTTAYDTEEPEINDIPIETEYMTNILRVYGRQFDDLKRYLENIKFTANVSYNEQNNIPDNILSKMLEYNGWDVKNVGPLESNTIGTDVGYPGENRFATSEDANIEFMKRLALNSRSILSRKGTRAGLKMMYSLFGIPEKGSVKHAYSGNTTYETGYTISEYDVLATKFPNGAQIDEIRNINEKKDSFYREYKETQDDLTGLLVSEIDVVNNQGTEIEYLVPWHNKELKYDSTPYFQMFGGWGKRNKHPLGFALTPNIKEVGGNTNIYNFGIYDETRKNVNIANHSYELATLIGESVFDGEVYYVIDVEPFLNDNTGVTVDEVSHYFVCRPSGYSTTRPVIRYDADYEWVPVYFSDFALDEDELGFARNAARVLYAESINDVVKANNPHNGKTVYDDGAEYFNYYEKIFHAADANEDYFSQYKASLAEQNALILYKNRFVNPENPINQIPDVTTGCSTYGFGVYNNGQLNLSEDNKKIWFFIREDTEDNWSSGIYKRQGANGQWGTINTATDFALTVQDADETFSPYKITDLSRGGNSELSSYSVLNSKKLVITYNLSEYYRDYVTNVVEPYIKQLAPSTTILEFVWNTVESQSTGTCRSEVFGMVGDDPTVFGVLSDDEISNRSSSLSLSPSSRRVSSTTTRTKLDVKSKNIDNNSIGVK